VVDQYADPKTQRAVAELARDVSQFRLRNIHVDLRLYILRAVADLFRPSFQVVERGEVHCGVAKIVHHAAAAVHGRGLRRNRLFLRQQHYLQGTFVQ